ncbi:MAG: hypothetical protein ACXU8X_20680, partial [Caulobacteraceae bacterium]
MPDTGARRRETGDAEVSPNRAMALTLTPSAFEKRVGEMYGVRGSCRLCTKAEIWAALVPAVTAVA